MKIREEYTQYVLLGLAIIGFILLFDKYFGLVAISMLLVDWQMFSHKKGHAMKTFERKGMSQKDGFIFLGFFGLFIGSTYVIGRILYPETFVNLFSSFKVFSATMPPLRQNWFVYLMAQGIVIAIVETRLFFVRIPEFFSENFRFKLKFDLSNVKIWAMILSISGLFVFYHIGVKDITNASALFATFMFGIVSILLVIYFRQGKEAQMLHIGNNVPAVLKYVIGSGGVV